MCFYDMKSVREYAFSRSDSSHSEPSRREKEFYSSSTFSRFGSARLIGLMFASDCFSRNISLAHLNQSASHSSSMGSLSRTNAVKKPSTYLTDSV